jgi:hypothetical protein
MVRGLMPKYDIQKTDIGCIKYPPFPEKYFPKTLSVTEMVS